MDRWGQYFKPAGMSQNTGDPQKSAPKASAPSHDEDDEPAPKAAPTPAPAAESTGTGDSRAQDILAMIRNRQK
jgi:hypothetical protein